MRISCYSLVLFLAVIGNACAETVELPRGNLGRSFAPEVTARAKTASAAAQGASQLSSWLNGLGLSVAVNRSLKQIDKHIGELMGASGQPGILVFVGINKLPAEIPRYELAGDSVQLIGAGTSADDVYLTRRPTISSPHPSDLDESYFLWYTKSGKQIQVSTIPAKFVVYEGAQRVSDAKIREGLIATADARALALAVENMERTTKSNDIKQQITALKKKQAETNQRVSKIEADLHRELERVRKATVVANQLAMLSTVFSVASQVSSAMSYLGNDTPKSVSDAKTPEELKGAVDNLLSESIKNRDELQLRYNSVVEEKSGIRHQTIQVLTTGKYPLNEVPQIQP